MSFLDRKFVTIAIYLAFRNVICYFLRDLYHENRTKHLRGS